MNGFDPIVPATFVGVAAPLVAVLMRWQRRPKAEPPALAAPKTAYEQWVEKNRPEQLAGQAAYEKSLHVPWWQWLLIIPLALALLVAVLAVCAIVGVTAFDAIFNGKWLQNDWQHLAAVLAVACYACPAIPLAILSLPGGGLPILFLAWVYGDLRGEPRALWLMFLIGCWCGGCLGGCRRKRVGGPE